MSCERIKDLLTAYIDHELTAEQEALVEEHIAKCPECRELLAMFKAIPDSFSETILVDAPPSIRRNVMAGIKAEHQVFAKKRWNLRRVAAAFVIFCLSFATGMLPLINMSSMSEDNMMLDAAMPEASEAAYGEQLTITDEAAVKAADPDNSGEIMMLVPDESAETSRDCATEMLTTAKAEEPEIVELSWYEKLPKEPLLFAVTGMFFAVLLLWTARPL